MPKISVIMPVFNGENHLKEAVESILNQCFEDFEFIIVNDGSSDGTSDILADYKDNRIRLIERENRGFARSLNEGIQIAKGHYIARMDADDVALEERFQWQYDFMESHPHIDILGGQAYIIDSNGSVTGEMRKPVSWKNISHYIKFACPICHPTYFVRPSVYDLTGGYRNMPPVEDYDFLLRSFEKGFIMENLPLAVLKYRRGKSGMSTGNPQRTVTLTLKAQELHRMRVKNKKEDRNILRTLESYAGETKTGFRILYRIREGLLKKQKDRKGFLGSLYFLLAVGVSLGDYRLFLNSYNGYRSLKWNSGQKKEGQEGSGESSPLSVAQSQ